MPLRHSIRDEQGAVLVEVTVVMTIMFVFILGSIEFLFALYQWNAATKAVQIGARIAAVSDPVAAGLNNLSLAVVSASVPPGSAMTYFMITCDGARASCTCNTGSAWPYGMVSGDGPNAGGTCNRGGAGPGVGGYDQAAMNTLVFGRGSSSC